MEHSFSQALLPKKADEDDDDGEERNDDEVSIENAYDTDTDDEENCSEDEDPTWKPKEAEKEDEGQSNQDTEVKKVKPIQWEKVFLWKEDFEEEEEEEEKEEELEADDDEQEEKGEELKADDEDQGKEELEADDDEQGEKGEELDDDEQGDEDEMEDDKEEEPEMKEGDALVYEGEEEEAEAGPDIIYSGQGSVGWTWDTLISFYRDFQRKVSNFIAKIYTGDQVLFRQLFRNPDSVYYELMENLQNLDIIVNAWSEELPIQLTQEKVIVWENLLAKLTINISVIETLMDMSSNMA